MSEPKSIGAPEENPPLDNIRRALPPPDLIREHLEYDPDSGLFHWKVWKQRRSIGRPCGAKSNGYLVLGFEGRQYLLHRVAWWMVHGEWPSCDIDHINGIRSDNRIENLRVATRSQNLWNRRRITSKHLGVSVVRGKYRARIYCNGKHYSLGYFNTVEEATAARDAKARELFGDFAPSES